MPKDREVKKKEHELTQLMKQAFSEGDTHKAYEYSREIRGLRNAKNAKRDC